MEKNKEAITTTETIIRLYKYIAEMEIKEDYEAVNLMYSVLADLVKKEKELYDGIKLKKEDFHGKVGHYFDEDNIGFLTRVRAVTVLEYLETSKRNIVSNNPELFVREKLVTEILKALKIEENEAVRKDLIYRKNMLYAQNKELEERILGGEGFISYNVSYFNQNQVILFSRLYAPTIYSRIKELLDLTDAEIRPRTVYDILSLKSELKMLPVAFQGKILVDMRNYMDLKEELTNGEDLKACSLFDKYFFTKEKAKLFEKRK